MSAISLTRPSEPAGTSSGVPAYFVHHRRTAPEGGALPSPGAIDKPNLSWSKHAPVSYWLPSLYTSAAAPRNICRVRDSGRGTLAPEVRMQASRTNPTERLVRATAWVYLVPRFFKILLLLGIVAFAALLIVMQLAVRALQ